MMVGSLLVLLAALTLGVRGAQAADDNAEVNRTPVDDAAFTQISKHYAYDADLPLSPEVISTQTHDGRELPYLTDKVHFATVHDQTIIGYFAYQRDSTDATYSAVILLHGNNRYRGCQDTWTRTWLDILARDGYCVLAIDQYGYGERFVRGKAPNFWGNMGLHEIRDLARQQIVDVRRAVDYVFTRPEVDTTRVALMGESMGGFNACRAAGLEPRLASVVLVVTGAWPGSLGTDDPMWSEMHALNFAPRISAPTLMVYSKHDGVPSGQELFDALHQPKDIVWHDIDYHVILVEDQRPEIAKWLNEHLK